MGGGKGGKYEGGEMKKERRCRGREVLIESSSSD